MNEPRWLDRRAILLLHAEALAAHGVTTGLRDPSLLDSALNGPINQYLYDSAADLARLVAAYGFRLAKNHAFADGNKRIAFIATAVFVRSNRYRLVSEPIDEIPTMLSLNAGELSEKEFAAWLRAHSEIAL
jgi:death-on-curing protein